MIPFLIASSVLYIGTVVVFGLVIRGYQNTQELLLDRIQARDLAEYHAHHPVESTEPAPRRRRYADSTGLARFSESAEV